MSETTPLVTASRDTLARAYDPEAFEDHPIESRSHAAAIQWAVRRHMATEAADRALASGVVRAVDVLAEALHKAWAIGTNQEPCPEARLLDALATALTEDPS